MTQLINKKYKDKKNISDIKYKNFFIFFVFFVLILNIFLLSKVKDSSSFLILLLSTIVEICLLYILIKNKKSMLNFFHDLYFILLILGVIYLKNIYLLFLVFVIIISFITREIFQVCLFDPDKPITLKGTIPIIILLVIIITRIYFEKLEKKLLQF